MAKLLKYNMLLDGLLLPVTMDWNEANEETAKRESYNGEYAIEETETEEPASMETRLGNLETDNAEMREALEMILAGVTE